MLHGPPRMLAQQIVDLFYGNITLSAQIKHMRGNCYSCAVPDVRCAAALKVSGNRSEEVSGEGLFCALPTFPGQFTEDLASDGKAVMASMVALDWRGEAPPTDVAHPTLICPGSARYLSLFSFFHTGTR